MEEWQPIHRAVPKLKYEVFRTSWEHFVIMILILFIPLLDGENHLDE